VFSGGPVLNHLDRYGTGPLAGHRDIRQLHGPPGKSIHELIALGNWTAIRGLLREVQGQRRREDAQAARTGVNQHAVDRLAIGGAARHAHRDAGEQPVGVVVRRPGIHGDRLHVLRRCRDHIGAVRCGATLGIHDQRAEHSQGEEFEHHHRG
jgi:hypothetical protein